MATPIKMEVRGEHEVLFHKVFDAPRARVFDAMTTPAIMKEWLSPEGIELVVCEVERKPGGKFRYVWRSPNGEMGMSGTWVEFDPPRGLVQKEKFDEPWFPGDCSVTWRFEEAGEGTEFKSVVRYELREARDMVVASPMVRGVDESYARLDALLAKGK
jgi:uncharacterized protein YndB with AHSA1/START domain